MTDPIRLLHVDDDPAVLDLTATCLEREDPTFRIDQATSAAEGRQRLAESTYDCIVSDYEMPGEDGLAFLAAVREDHPDLPFVLFTGKGSESVASDAISAGVTDYLQKGTGTEQYTLLANRITNAVSRRRAAETADRQQHRLEQILTTVPACVVQLDREGEFVFANQRAEEVLGIEESVLRDRSYDDPEWQIRDLDGNPMPEEELPFRRVVDSGESVSNVRHSIRWPDGTEKVLLVNGAPLFNDDGAVESVVFSLADITDRVERERDLAATKRRLALALEATETGTWEWEIDADEMRWDEAIRTTLGIDADESIRTLDSFLDHVAPADRERVRAAVTDAIETDGNYECEFRMRTGGEEEKAAEDVRWVSARGQIVEEGDSRSLVGIATDITDSKQYEQELERSNTRYRTLVDNFPDGAVFLFDESQTYTLAGGEALGSLGLEPSDVVGSTPRKLFPADVAEEIVEQNEIALSGTETSFEVTAMNRQFHLQVIPILDGDEVTGAMGVAQDRTEQRIAEHRLQTLLDRTDTLVYVKDHDGRYELVNRAFADLVGVDPETLEGKSVAEVFDGDGATESQSTDEAVMESGEPVTEEVTRVVGDTERVFISNKFPYYGLDGEIRGVMGISRDITDRKRREETLERQNRRLNRFASVVSHDLRNPLNLAQGRLDLAREECDSEHLDAVETAHERIDRLVTDLLTLARQGAVVDEDDVTPVDLPDLAEEAWAETSTPTATLRLDAEGRIEADPERLRQLLGNLFRNAVEHAGDDAVVRCETTADGFAVVDDGPGFPAGQAETLAGDPGDDGVGLGLSIVGEIAEAHGWEVTLSDDADGGARIDVRGVGFV